MQEKNDNIHQFFLYKKHYKMLLRAKNEASMVVDAFCETKQGFSNTKNSETWALLQFWDTITRVDDRNINKYHRFCLVHAKNKQK